MFRPLHTSLLALLALSLHSAPFAKASPLIEITQKKSGIIIQIKVISLTQEKLTFKTKNGKVYTIKPETITSESLKKIQPLLKKLPRPMPTNLTRLTRLSPTLFLLGQVHSGPNPPKKLPLDSIGLRSPSLTNQAASGITLRKITNF